MSKEQPSSKQELCLQPAGSIRMNICGRHYQGYGNFGQECVCCQLERQNAEIERLRAELKQFTDWANPQLERLGREIVEVERLRAALEIIGADSPPNRILGRLEAWTYARKALRAAD